ncbi:unnamed protein product [Blepharisma stoltei]|uniref:Purple acid phosphatase n=1 Tax=Blepharisma stoltei TaxID=1481888 RepID=A0AAU9J4P3_9CILI|nr:unnamed protein product [Blepharisma stoltei]
MVQASKWFNFLLFLGIFQLAESAFGTPEHIHLAWTENEHEMMVSWSTFIPVDSFVHYRPILCNDAAENYEYTEVLGNRTMFNEGVLMLRFIFLHNALIKGIRSECFYEYFIQSSIGKSKTYIFNGRTPESDDSFNDTSNPFKMIIIGDLGGGDIGSITAALFQREVKFRDSAGLIHLGDLAYNLDTDNGLTGDNFLNLVQDLAATIPYMVLPGNHENFDNQTHYKMRFKMLKNEYNDGLGQFYSFNLGPAHFTIINTEVHFFENQTISANRTISAKVQRKWLENDLAVANKNRKERPWLFVLAHRPLYCSYDYLANSKERNRTCGPEAKYLREEYEELFNENAVDVFFTAHVHSYERITPIYHNVTVKSQYDDTNTHINPRATVHIVDGIGGNRLRHNAKATHTPQLWSVYRTDDYGYGKLTVYNKTHMLFEQYSSLTWNTIDTVSIIKTRERF